MTDIDKTLCDEAFDIVTGARRQTYDRPERNFERIAKVWEGLTDRKYTAHEVALMFVGLKIVRDAYSPQRDNKVDGIGYLLCADAVKPEPQTGSQTLKTEYTAFDFKMDSVMAPAPAIRKCTCNSKDFCKSWCGEPDAPAPARSAAPRDIPYVPNCDSRCGCKDKPSSLPKPFAEQWSIGLCDWRDGDWHCGLSAGHLGNHYS